MPFTRSARQRLATRSNLGTSHIFRGLVLLATAITFAPRVSHANDHNDIRVGRYTTMLSTPTVSQTDPLEAIVQVNFPRARVHSVGDATAYLLLRTGYRLAPIEQLDEQVKHILMLPLPEVHRGIGPYSVRNALAVLLGSPFSLSVDPRRREVSYRVEGGPEKAMQASNKTRLTTTPLASALANSNFQIATLGRGNDCSK
jgi:conjugative transfer region protein (TIGR03748 family)